MSRRPPPSSLRVAARLGLAACAVSCALAGEPSPSLQQRIDTLLKHRLKPELLPLNPANPFQMSTGLKREAQPEDLSSKPAVSDDVAPPPANGTDASLREANGPSPAEVLVACSTRLKLGGIIVLKEQIQIVVNGVPRKEGDSVAADWNNTIVYLKIVRLFPGHMVLRYGDAEVTVKF